MTLDQLFERRAPEGRHVETAWTAIVTLADERSSDPVARSRIISGITIVGAVLAMAVVAIALIDASLLSPTSAIEDRTLGALLSLADSNPRGSILGTLPSEAAAWLLSAPARLGTGWLQAGRELVAACAILSLLALVAAFGRIAASLLSGVLITAMVISVAPAIGQFTAVRPACLAFAAASLTVVLGWTGPGRPKIQPVAALLSGGTAIAAAYLQPAFWPLCLSGPLAMVLSGDLIAALLGVLAPLVVLGLMADDLGSLPLLSIERSMDTVHLVMTFGGIGLIIAVAGAALLRPARGAVPIPAIAGALFAVGGAILSGAAAVAALGLGWLAAALSSVPAHGRSRLPILVVLSGAALTAVPVLLGFLIRAPQIAASEDWPGTIALRQGRQLADAMGKQTSRRPIAAIAASRAIDAGPVAINLPALRGRAPTAADLRESMAGAHPSAILAGFTTQSGERIDQELVTWAITHGFHLARSGIDGGGLTGGAIYLPDDEGK